MTMTIGSNQQRFAGGLNYDHTSSNPTTQPQFTNPWISSSSAAVPQRGASHGMYSSSQQGLNPNPLSLDTLKHYQPREPVSRASTNSSASMGCYEPIPVTSASAGSLLDMGHNAFISLSLPQDLLDLNHMPHPQTTTAAYPEAACTTSASPIHSNYAASPTPYDSLGYTLTPTLAMAPESEQRRYSQPSVPSPLFSSPNDVPRALHQNSLIDVVDDRRSMQHDDRRSFADAIEASHTILSLSQETPRPQGMMGQFSSNVSSSTQKKYKCNVCDKRFTRPSSLQTHMYSHTGEKPFCCEVEGCGRHFSVVSNLRRHRKVHKGQARSETGSEDHHSDRGTPATPATS